MPARRAALCLVMVSAFRIAQPAWALPPMGAFSVEVGGTLSRLSTSDIENAYKPYVLDNHVSTPLGFTAGVAYNVSGSFQMGVGVEKVFKRYKVTWDNGDVDTWNIPAVGVLASLRWLMPGFSPDVLYGIDAAAGPYRLSAASMHPGGTDYHDDLAGSTFGGSIGLDSEIKFGESLSGVVLIGYRFANIRTVKATLFPDNISGELDGFDGSKVGFDYSGPYVMLALRFYIGGDGSTVTSQ